MIASHVGERLLINIPKFGCYTDVIHLNFSVMSEAANGAAGEMRVLKILNQRRHFFGLYSE
jgi:hypothetical protein